MSRLNKKFYQLANENQKAFIPFIMAGFPNISYSKNLLNKLPALGADIIEIGMPFTDPTKMRGAKSHRRKHMPSPQSTKVSSCDPTTRKFIKSLPK